MKPLYSPAEVQFRAMKEEPEEHHWSSLPSYKMHMKIMQTSNGPYLRVSHTISENPIEDGVQWIKLPFLPGEKCYLREGWAIPLIVDGIQPNKIGQNWIDHWKKEGLIWYRSAYLPEPTAIPLAGKGSWRSPVTMPLWAARRFFTIVSCVPVRVSEVTEEDIIKAGLADGSCEWASGAARCDKNGNLVVNQFMDNWHQRHPGKEWTWRIAIQNTERGE